MPTECERSLTSPSGITPESTTPSTAAAGVVSAALIAAEIQSSYEDSSQQQQQQSATMEGDNMSTSQTSTTSNGSSCNGGIRKTSITSPDPTAYVAKARVTRPTPPPPPYNPMQFVQIKPCSLYQTAQEQLKKAEEVKKIKEIRKEEPEDWQNNLDNWKSSRRKRVEHIIDRVVEVKKLELEEHDRTRRKSKTFSELIENRGERVGRPGLNKLASLAVYNEDETNDLSDLGIGTSSASGKSSLSEDYDNNSVMSDNAAELDKAKPITDKSTTREYISSPGYETSSSTAPASSPDPCEYTYEGAIQDYKQRVSRAASGLTAQTLSKLSTSTQQPQHNSKESTPERSVKETSSYPPRRGSKIEDRLIGFEVQSPSEEWITEKSKVDVPKIDILKLRDRFKPQDISEPVEVTSKKDVKRLSGDITSIKERLQSLELQQNIVNGANGASKSTANKLVDIPVPPLKERLSSLQSAVTKEDARKPPVALVDARQLEIMKSEEQKRSKHIIIAKEEVKAYNNSNSSTTTPFTNITSTQPQQTKTEDSVDRDDSGIHTADEDPTEQIKKEQEHKLNAAIEALAMQEQQLTEAATAVNQIEAEFEELSLGSVTLPPLATSNGSACSSNTTTTNTNTITNDHMEYSINEALELALAAIDKESSSLPTQIEESFPQPRTVPSSNSTSIITTQKSLLIHQCQQQQQQQQQTETIILINKTDEEKFRKLHNQVEQTNIPAMLEKLEEEISKEPIYENVTTTTVVKNLCEKVHELDVTTKSNTSSSNTTTTTKTAATTTTTATAYEEEEHPPKIIPSMITNQRQQPIDATTTTPSSLSTTTSTLMQQNNQNSKQNQNYENCNQNQSATTAATTISINHNNNNNTNNNNNNNNRNNNINNRKHIDIDNDNDIDNNSSNDNLVELTNAFANQTIIESITTAATATAFTADNHDDDIITVKITSNNNKNNNNSNNNNNNKNLSRDNHHANGKLFKDSTTVTIEQKPVKTNAANTVSANTTTTTNDDLTETTSACPDPAEPYYQVPKSCEPYYDAPKHLKPIPVYENIEIFFNGSVSGELSAEAPLPLQPPKEKPPPPPVDSPPLFDDDVDSPMDTNYSSSDNTYETLTRHQQSHLYQQQQQQQQQQQMQQHHLTHPHPHHHQLQPHIQADHPSPPMKRMNSTKRIKKELRNKRSSFLGIEGSSLDDDDSYLELTVAPPPDMAQLLQEERRLEKQMYLKAGLCDSSDTGESRDSGVSENHSRQSSEHYTNSSEENEPHDDTTSPLTLQTQIALDNNPSDMIYQNDGLLAVAPTPLLQTVKGNSAESWTESATVAAAATQSLTEATATANAKMMSIEEKIREQEEVLRVERELLQLEQEELKRQRENLMLRETMARRELQHGAKMLMSANRRSLQDLNGLGTAMTVMTGGGNVDIGGGMMPGNNVDIYQMNQMNGYCGGSQHYQPKSQLSQQGPQQQHQQQIYANIPNLQQQYYQTDTDYRKSMSDINEFSKHMMQPPVPPSKPMRAMHMSTANRMINGTDVESPEFNSRQRHSLNSQHFGGSLVKIATGPTAAPRGGPPHIYSNFHHQSAQNLNASSSNLNHASSNNQSMYPGNMSRNTLHALSATPKPKYTDGWVQVQQRKSYDTNFANDPAWVSAYQQKRKSMPDASYQQFNGNNHWLVQEAEQRRLAEQQQRRVQSSNTATPPVHQSSKHMSSNGGSVSNGKPLPDSIIQTLTERVQSKGIGERKRNMDKSPLHAASQYQQYNSKPQQQQPHQIPNSTQNHIHQQQQHQSSANVVTTHRHQHTNSASMTTAPTTNGQLNNSTISTSAVTSTSTAANTSQDKVLSVSGKKKCSHCGDELGRGAAMIIESLLLFYHINCFKCCVCHVQLGDGLNGTDVRVRNHKLHCQNCYSSDDGIKFSCV